MDMEKRNGGQEGQGTGRGGWKGNCGWDILYKKDKKKNKEWCEIVAQTWIMHLMKPDRMRYAA